MRATARFAAAVLFPVLLAPVLLVAGCGDDPTVVTGGGTVSSTGGDIQVECMGRFKVRIVDTTAAAGYTANLLVPGPAGQVSLIFENPEADDVRVAISCRNGQPQLSEWVRDR